MTGPPLPDAQAGGPWTPGTDAAPGLGWARLWDRWGRWFVAVGGVGVVLLFVGLGAWGVYGYRTGTATTATVDFCASNAKHYAKTQNCMATWNVDGVSHYGGIEGVDNSGYPDGASVAVHVRGNAAYTPAAGNSEFWWAAEIGGLFSVAVLLDWWRRRRRR